MTRSADERGSGADEAGVDARHLPDERPDRAPVARAEEHGPAEEAAQPAVTREMPANRSEAQEPREAVDRQPREDETTEPG